MRNVCFLKLETHEEPPSPPFPERLTHSAQPLNPSPQRWVSGVECAEDAGCSRDNGRSEKTAPACRNDRSVRNHGLSAGHQAAMAPHANQTARRSHKSEIRISKSETSTKFQGQNTNERRIVTRRCFEFCSFGFVSDFGFCASDFLPVGKRGAPLWLPITVCALLTGLCPSVGSTRFVGTLPPRPSAAFGRAAMTPSGGCSVGRAHSSSTTAYGRLAG